MRVGDDANCPQMETAMYEIHVNHDMDAIPEVASLGRGIDHPDAPHVTPFDTASGVVGPLIPIRAIIGVSEFAFDFFNEGGTNNLKPGRPTSQTASYNAGGAPGFIVLRSFNGIFVTDGGTHLTERPLGEFEVDVFFSGPGQITCKIRLTDSNADDPVKVQVRGLIVFFR
jgi:hypothetical protein